MSRTNTLARALLVATALLCAACPSRARAPESAAEETPTMTQQQDKDFVPGLALEPADRLLDWLEDTIEPARATIRLPIVVRFEDEHRLGWGAVTVGTAGDALHVQLDDGALGEPLLDRLAADCPREAESCSLWMEGYWGALVEMPELDLPGHEPEGPKRHPFAVLKVLGPVSEGDPAAALVADPAP